MTGSEVPGTAPAKTARGGTGASAQHVRRTVEAVWRLESARIVGGLARLVHDVGLAEEVAQEALVAALEQWPSQGVPDNPAGWLTTIAKRRAIDHLRRAGREERAAEQVARELDRVPTGAQQHDDVLRLMFLTCHPVLPTPARVALTLRLVGGLSTAQIARAFLVDEARIARRIAAAKRTLAAEHVLFELPAATEQSERLSSVLGVLYLIFNEGYSATSGDDLIRSDLCLEALRLGRVLAELAPQQAEVHGLVALMEIQTSRTAARTGPGGEPIQLHEQNRGRWDQLLIRRGFAALLRARSLGQTPGPYVLQAAIAVCHAQAATAADTDWVQITTLYDALVRLLPTPVVRLNRAVAIGMANGPAAGLAAVDALLVDPALRDYHLLPAVRADLLTRLGRYTEARRDFERAAALTHNVAEQSFLRGRAQQAAASGQPPGPAERTAPTLGTATADFLTRPELDAGTARSYRQTLNRLCLHLGEHVPLASLTAQQVAQVFAATWADAAARTWNRHRAAVRSFATWAAVDGLAAAVDRRPEDGARPVPIAADQLSALLNDTGQPLRERTLWRMLYESGAQIGAVLSLNVEDLDLDDRRARAAQGWIAWRSGTAELLPHLLTGRTRGPLFLTQRRPAPPRANTPDHVCPDTGRGRLSYERAEYLFKQATRSVDPTGTGYTLRRLRPPVRSRAVWSGAAADE